MDGHTPLNKMIYYTKSQIFMIERFLVIKFNFTVNIIDIMFSKSNGIVKHIFKLWQYTRNLSKQILKLYLKYYSELEWNFIRAQQPPVSISEINPLQF